MKGCAYCGMPMPKKMRRWWRTPFSSMGDSEPICDRCVLHIKPELITGFIGVNIL